MKLDIESAYVGCVATQAGRISGTFKTATVPFAPPKGFAGFFRATVKDGELTSVPGAFSKNEAAYICFNGTRENLIAAMWKGGAVVSVHRRHRAEQPG